CVSNIYQTGSKNIIEVEFTHKSKQLYEMLNILDNQIINYVVTNSENLFGIKFDYVAYSDKYKKSAKLPKHIPGFPMLYLNISNIAMPTPNKNYNFTISIDKIFFNKTSSWLNMSIISIASADELDNSSC